MPNTLSLICSLKAAAATLYEEDVQCMQSTENRNEM